MSILKTAICGGMILLAVFAGCMRTGLQVSAPGLAEDRPADYPGVHNVVTYAPGLYSGSVPEGAAGFDTLAAMGVKTVISVDGAEPDVAAARARGMRYVHLPISYNGMARERSLEITRAIRDLPGPIYLHCHHGKHRSAAALGVAGVALGLMENDQALARMKVSGTSPHYKGLWRCVREAGRVSREELDQVSAAFPEIHPTPSLVKAMVRIDEGMDHLRLIQKAAWQVPPEHPDLVPAAEAGRMADLFRHLETDPSTKEYPALYLEQMKESRLLASALEEAMLVSPTDPVRLGDLFSRLSGLCRDCHNRFRD